jgi:hypothetical protein
MSIVRRMLRSFPLYIASSAMIFWSPGLVLGSYAPDELLVVHCRDLVFACRDQAFIQWRVERGSIYTMEAVSDGRISSAHSEQ